MIGRTVLLVVFLPIAVSAQIASGSTASSTPPCGTPSLAPLPSSVPVPEMVRAQDASVSCISLPTVAC